MSARAVRQAGFTMVEMMVAMTLGLLLVVVIGQVFVTSKESYRTTEDLSRMQENARFAAAQLSRVIRMAAFTTDPLANRTALFPLATAPAVSGIDGGGTVADQVIVRHQGSGAGTADGSILDCQGNAIRADEMAVARFFLAAGANGANALFCDNTGTVGPGIVTTQVELASDVENMQILYGEDTDLDATANRYLPASDVASFDNVVSVRIALLVRSTNQVAASLNTSTYNLLGAVFDPVDDRRVRRVYTATITLRNRAP